MKRAAILALAIISLAANADHQTDLSKAIDAIRPATGAAGKYVVITEDMQERTMGMRE